MAGYVAFSVIIYFVGVGSGVLLAYNAYTFLEKDLNIIVVLVGAIIIMIIAFLLNLADAFIFSHFVFSGGIALLTYGIVAPLVIAQNEEEKEDVSAVSQSNDLEERIKAMKEKNRQ